jgi:ABC-2 type transport system permease protein
VSVAVFRAMLLAFLRDRAALVMSFVLPVVFFLVFGAIFSGAGGGDLRLSVAVADEVRSDVSQRLLRALLDDPAVRGAGQGLDAAAVRELVRRGRADVGLVVRAGGEPLGAVGGFGKPPLVVVSDPTRAVAAQMLVGLVQRAYFTALPDVALGGVAALIEQDLVTLDAAQKRQLAEGLAGLKDDAEQARREGRRGGAGLEDMFDHEAVVGRSQARNLVAYYAGAVAFLFLLFSTVHGAVSLIEERDAGLLDRILAGPASTAVLVNGKFLFLAAQGFAQVAVIFLVAWLVHGVDVPHHAVGCAVVTLAAAVAASGFALALVSACRTRRQAQALSNVVILVVSALGGSMVPRFFMPPLLQRLGWATPNAWAIEAYASVLWRGDPPAALVPPLVFLCGLGLAGYLAARRLARRWETI